ncbi:MAG TPA: hypothetical protein VNV63_02365 [Nitrospiria bacterium]|jgi:hypothetical protein|nr:hypothetical protein [Nitrospiria bacterium]
MMEIGFNKETAEAVFVMVLAATQAEGKDAYKMSREELYPYIVSALEDLKLYKQILEQKP